MSLEYTSTLAIKYIMPNQSDKEITINDGFLKIDNAIKALQKTTTGAPPDIRPEISIVVAADGSILRSDGRYSVMVRNVSSGRFTVSFVDNHRQFNNKGFIFYTTREVADGMHYGINASVGNDYIYVSTFHLGQTITALSIGFCLWYN